MELQLFSDSDFEPVRPEPPTPTYSPVLFGRDTTERLVAVEAQEDRLCIWQRGADDSLRLTYSPFLPWILCECRQAVAAQRVAELDGVGFRVLYEFSGRRAFEDARRVLRDAHADHLTYPNATKLALTRTGMTLFKGMAMHDVVRMQVDIETATLSPADPAARVLVIAVGDNRGLLDTLTGPEDELLDRFVALVSERDPDVIEGHNILGFDLPYLMARAHHHSLGLALGRDGSEARVAAPRNFAIGGNTRPFTPVYVFGRHVIDTYLAVQRFDAAKGSLSSYGLKEVARAFGIASEDRIQLDRERLADTFEQDADRVLEYARQDIEETARLAELVTATEFYQTQMVPDAYHSCAVTGSGEKINSLFVRAYLAEGCAIPKPLPTKSYAGGYTDVLATGVLDRVVKADVESLYPSIMLSSGIRPRTDTLNAFLPALQELTTRRLDAKRRVKGSTGTERHYWDGLQNSFKVLINSFYGYLGAAPFNFNDPEAAGRVTETGQRIVRTLAESLERTGSRLIEIDTDGVYFVPPDNVEGEDAERAYVDLIGRDLPEGIRLAFDGRFRSMVSLKTKNYVLLGYDGRKVAKGASLRSRADEPYGREFLNSAVDLLLERRLEDIGGLYAETIDRLVDHRVPVEHLARRERITEKTFTSGSKSRSAEVARNTSVGEYVVVYERSNGRLGLLADYVDGDENTSYYVDKLYKFACRLRDAFPGTFDQIIPKPPRDLLASRAQLGLFDL